MLNITSPNEKNKIEVISLIDSKKKPVIFWDTCSLLDIIRLPLPNRNNTTVILENIIEIKNKIHSKDIISISSALCITEFNDNIENCKKELELESKKLTKNFNTFTSFINQINLGGRPIEEIDLPAFKIENLLLQIIHTIIDETIFISEDNSFATFAHFRLTNKIPPAKKKGEYKDCYIWGTCLNIRQESRDQSYPYHFMSSNISDFAKKNKLDFVTEIENEAIQNNINYFPNFNVAYGRLRNDGIL